MSKKQELASRRLVVDANVLRGASRTDGGPPAGVRCRGVVQAVLRICHRAVLSPAVAGEYDKHASGFAVRWLAAMQRKGKIVDTAAATTGRSRGWLQETSYSPAEREAVEKDLHLVLAAPNSVSSRRT